MKSRITSLLAGVALLGSVALGSGLPQASAAQAEAPAQKTTIRLASVAGSSVRGTAVLVALDGGTRLSWHVAGAAPGTVLRSFLNAGTCALPGASTRLLGVVRGNAAGRASAIATSGFALSFLADGRHIIDLRRWDASTSSFQEVACGGIPRLAP